MSSCVTIHNEQRLIVSYLLRLQTDLSLITIRCYLSTAMKTILLPTDFTTNTQLAADWAKLFARQYNAKLIVLHVYQPPLPDATIPTLGDIGTGMMANADLEQIGRENVEKVVDQLRREGFTADSDWRMGNVEDEIVNAANELDADLIVTGRSAMTGFFDRLVGSAATDIARAATCPVLVVPNLTDEQTPAPVQVKHITYATVLEFDESEMMAQAQAVAQAFEADMHLVNVDADNQLNINDDKELLANLQEQADAPLPIDTVKSRTVTKGLREYLEEHPTDLLVMTTRDNGFLANLINPSQTERMLNRTTVPVLVLHRQ